jgi:hypothetical protein
MGITVATHFLSQCGFEFKNAIECYKSHDFVVSKNGREYLIEVEVSARWNTLAFPYETMSVPFRKKDSKADIYIRMNANGSALFCCPMKQVFKAPVITKNTCYTTGEKFFNVDVKELNLYISQDGIWCDENDERIDDINFEVPIKIDIKKKFPNLFDFV